MDKTVDIDEVVAGFSKWRNARGKRGNIPEALIKQALSLIGGGMR